MTTPAPICLITGATEGVGRATAIALAREGFTIALVARDRDKAEALRREIGDGGGGDVACFIADLASLRQVHAIADAFRRRYARLDVLINNAGVFSPARTLTEDGFEATYQVNYLSHVLLTQLLLDELERSEQGRIINLTSSVYRAGRFDPDNLQSEQRFSVLGAYAASKLFLLMFTEELARRLVGTRVTANAVHPGIVRTRMMREAPGAFRIASWLSLPLSIAPEEGARTTVFLATSPSVSGVSGRYFVRSRARATKSRFDTEDNRRRLWDLTTESLRSFAPTLERPAG